MSMSKPPLSMLRRALVLALAVSSLASVAVMPARAVNVAHGSIVNDEPANRTPDILDGRVNAILPIGNTIVVGGTFSRVRSAGATTALGRQFLFSFDASTGRVDPGFTPRLAGFVEALAPGPDGTSVFVGGAFRAIDGDHHHRRLARLRLSNGSVVNGFQANADALVRDLVFRGSKLYAGGEFSRIGGTTRLSMARLDPATGAVDPTFDIAFTRPRNGGVREIRRFDVSPDGQTLVAIGNFSRVDGRPRDQIAIIDTGPATATLSSWSTSLLPFVEPRHRRTTWCIPFFPSWVRDLDISPDGTYFVLTTTGANHPGRLCDSISRWELGPRGPGQRPTWVNNTGGDTVFAVTVTGAAVYIGGHQQWVNNPYNPFICGVCPGPFPGGVERRGISAHDPLNGLPYTWNPGRNPRGKGVLSMPSTPTGLWVGSDTDFIAGERHGKIAFMPLAGGTSVPPNTPAGLPGDLYRITRRTGVMQRRPFDGSTYGPATAVASGVNGRRVRAAFELDGLLYTAGRRGTFGVRSFDGTSAGSSSTIDLHGLEVAPDPNAFSIPGTSKPIPSLSRQLKRMTGIFFDRGRVFYTVGGDDRLYERAFTPQSLIVGAPLFVASTGDGVDWSKVRGMTMASGELFLGMADGTLRRVAWNGRHPVGHVKVLGGPSIDGVDWSSRGLFIID